MKYAIALCLAFLCVMASCSEDVTVEEAITTPDAPVGDDYADVAEVKAYETGGAKTSRGHPVEYRFDFDTAGGHRYTGWTLVDTASTSWPSPGAYTVKTQARCAKHPEIVSGWSPGLIVGVAVQLVSTPRPPDGPNHAYPQVAATYCTGGAVSNVGHAVEYQFDFDAAGEHDYSSWDTSSCTTVTWPDNRTYLVSARARSADHTDIITPWTAGKTVTVAPPQFLPEIRFSTHIRGISKPYYFEYLPVDTVGMYRSFAISYHGVSANGDILAYKYFPISTTVTIPGSNIWNFDLSDTMRVLANSGDDAIPSGIFKFAAQCLDEAYAESPINPATYVNGVCRVVVNFDPDTRIDALTNNYVVDGVPYEEDVDFTDGVPDTVPYGSWVRLDYSGWDDPRDGTLCDPSDPDKCIDFQFRYVISRTGPDVTFQEDSRWLPRDGMHDSDPNSASDSTSLNAGSLEYTLRIRSIDENGRGDGVPPSVEFVGNHAPTIDVVEVEDHLGNQLDLSVIDTLTWDFWKGEGWPYTCFCDTVDIGSNFACPDHDCPPGPGTYDFFKTFSFLIKATGHDHPKDPSGSGVKAWQYIIYDSSGDVLPLGLSGQWWINGSQTNAFEDRVSVRFDYPGPLSTDPPPDPLGDAVFDNLPSWLNQDLTLVIWGRDTYTHDGSEVFTQYVFLNGERFAVNAFAANALGRWTETKTYRFHIRLVRSGTQ